MNLTNYVLGALIWMGLAGVSLHIDTINHENGHYAIADAFGCPNITQNIGFLGGTTTCEGYNLIPEERRNLMDVAQANHEASSYVLTSVISVVFLFGLAVHLSKFPKQ